MWHMGVLQDGELNRWFGDFMNPRGLAAPAMAPTTFVPAVDVREDADGLVLVADLPGLKAEDVKLSFDQGVLILAGEREPVADPAATYHRTERRAGAFERRFTLPVDVDGTAVEASMNAGVLTIRLPKRPEAKPRTIEIKAR